MQLRFLVSAMLVGSITTGQAPRAVAARARNGQPMEPVFDLPVP
jgi:hypothetical protein